MEELVVIRDMCKVYNPGENEVRALDHVNLKLTGMSLWQLSDSPAPENLP